MDPDVSRRTIPSPFLDIPSRQYSRYERILIRAGSALLRTAGVGFFLSVYVRVCLSVCLTC